MKQTIDNLEINEELQASILSSFNKQIADWQIAIPKAKPLVMDFGQNEFYKTGLIECWLTNEIAAGYCAKYMFLFDQQQCPYHSHQQKHETFFIVKGQSRMIVNGKEQILNEGDVLTVPPGDIHSFYGIGSTLLLEMSTPCLVEDNIFEDAKIAKWLKNCITTS